MLRRFIVKMSVLGYFPLHIYLHSKIFVICVVKFYKFDYIIRFKQIKVVQVFQFSGTHDQF